MRCRDDAGRDPAAERWCDLIERLDTFPCERPHHLALQDPAVIDFIVHTVSKVHPMKHYRQVVSPQLRQQALDWILAAARRPDPALEPEFDIADDERREAKVRNLHRHDPLFWDDWFARSGLDALVRDHLRKPRLLRHAAFIKRHADESHIPLHQDIALWEKR